MDRQHSTTAQPVSFLLALYYNSLAHSFPSEVPSEWMKNGFRVEELKTPHCVAAAAGAMRAEGGGRQHGKPNLGVARSLDVVVVNGGDGDDVNQLHVTLDTSAAANGKWGACRREGGREGSLEDAFMI